MKDPNTEILTHVTEISPFKQLEKVFETYHKMWWNT